MLREPEAPREIRRHLFFVAGFDPMAPDAHHALVRREAGRFAQTWGVAASAAPEAEDTGTGLAFPIDARGPGWRSRATFELLAWDDIVRADMQRGRWSHFVGTVRALADMIRTGTVVRYFRTSHRYGLFFVLTYVLLALLWGLAATGGLLTFRALAGGLGGALAAAGGAVVTLALGALLMRWPGRRFRLKQSLDLAEFSVDFVRGRRPELDARVAAFAERVAAVAAAEGPDAPDEIVLAGHSLGAMHVVSLVALALARHPGFGTRVPVRLLTMGSTTAKFALHPAGERLRAAAVAVRDAPRIGWAEFQARDDIVSFYKVDPVTLGRIAEGDARRRPLVRRVSIREMMTPAAFARHRLDVMRLHCQFFLANRQRSPYDFYAFVCAPVPFDTLAAMPSGPLGLFAADGGLLPSSADPRTP